ncbi:hypothetical protein K458DRAFT_310126, partial [Lentithecium fluviatile CBS 122367]
LQSCPPLTTKTLSTSTTTRRSISRPPPSSTTTSSTKPYPTHDPCGGFRLPTPLTCKEGYICIKDPYRPGCGPECDGPGICVRDKMCGGFAGFACPERGQVCHDDPRDTCDPQKGGADCGGLCVWPHGVEEDVVV